MWTTNIEYRVAFPESRTFTSPSPTQKTQETGQDATQDTRMDILVVLRRHPCCRLGRGVLYDATAVIQGEKVVEMSSV